MENQLLRPFNGPVSQVKPSSQSSAGVHQFSFGAYPDFISFFHSHRLIVSYNSFYKTAAL